MTAIFSWVSNNSIREDNHLHNGNITGNFIIHDKVNLLSISIVIELGWTPTWRLHTKLNTKIWEDRHFSEYLARVRTLLSSPNSMTFHRFFHDLFKFCMTYGLAVTLKNFQTPPSLRVFLTLNSSTDTNSGVHKNACRTRYSITPLCPTLPLLLSSEVSREVTTQNFDFPRLLRTDH